MRQELTCLVLAAGLGSRLKSIEPNVPKPMVKVGGKPFLEYLIEELKRFGIKDIILCVAYKSKIIEDYFKNGENRGVKIRYSKRNRPSGTAGEIINAKNLINSDPFLVINGDSYCETDITKAVKFHESRKAMATVVVTKIADVARYGNVILGPKNSISKFEEKGRAKKEGYINGGVYVFSRKILKIIRDYECSSLEYELFPILINRGIFAFKASGIFVDIGTPQSLKRARKNFRKLLKINKYL